MVGQLLVAAALVSVPQQVDASAFSDPSTAVLFARARVRHIRQDSLVRDYRARIHTRIEATVGRSRFGRLTSLFVHETEATVAWQTPNDLRVEILGARTALPALRMIGRINRKIEGELDQESRGLGSEALLDRPWFVPRALGDSVRLLGVPSTAALHPLAPDAESIYRYAIRDTLTLRLPSQVVRAVRMRVEPRVLGPSMIAGDMWLDAETADVVRLMVVFIGEYLWEEPKRPTAEDSTRARNANKWASRFITTDADIEYALVHQQYWMPRRQVLLQTVTVPWFADMTVPVRAITTFDAYRINTDTVLTFALDAPSDPRGTELRVKSRNAKEGDRGNDEDRRLHGYLRGGVWDNGRWEVNVPPEDSLARHEWEREFRIDLDDEEEAQLRESIAALARLEEDLPAQWVGHQRLALAWERFSDLFRFNRVQGPSLGVGYQLRPGPAFTTLHVTARFGLADQRPTGSLTWRRDGPGGRLDLSVYRVVQDAEPWTNGQGFGNSLNALVTGHDDADYLLAFGGGLSHTWHSGLLRDVEVGLFGERQRSMAVEAGSIFADLVGDGDFQPNPPVIEGDFFRAAVRHVRELGPVEWRQGAETLLGEDRGSVRLWTGLRVPFAIASRTGTLTLRGGLTRGDALSQMLVRVGGTETVRGYTYGTRVGREFWSAQLDIGLSSSPYLAPVAFVDVGDTFTGDPLVGIGAGLSILHGLVRLNLAKGLNPGTDVRFDLFFNAPR